MRDTIAAIATPPGTGALGVARASGPRALPLSLELLGLKELSPRRATVAAVEGIDRLVATWFPAGESPTGEDLVELSAHGSPAILSALVEALCALGARPARPGEFTQRAFLNGKLDLAQAEAVAELIAAKTEGARRAALRQLGGELSREIERLRRPILELLVAVEAALDHPDEGIPSAEPSAVRRTLGESAGELERLAATFDATRLARHGARVCLVGRPNAGKSSLLNALLGRERAIVCERPGTTRDTLEEPSSVGLLIDTAGLREATDDPAEAHGLERSRRALESCDLALLVIDGSRPWGPEDERVHRGVLSGAARLGRPVLTVRSKADLPAVQEFPADAAVSALSREGIDELLHQVSARLAPPEPPTTLISIRHKHCLQAAAVELRSAEAQIGGPDWEAKAAFHLREALRRADEITGASAPEEVIRRIFERFCIGK